MSTDGGAQAGERWTDDDWRNALAAVSDPRTPRSHQIDICMDILNQRDALSAQVAAMREVLRVVAEPTPAARTPEQLRAILTAQRRAAQEVLRDGRR